MNIAVLVPAAGTGSRIGGAVPKTLLTIGHSLVIQRTIAALRTEPRLRTIMVMVPQDFYTHFRSIPVLPDVEYVVGGASRALSVQSGLKALKERAERFDYVMIHDGARAFVEPSLLTATIDAAIQYQAVTAAIPMIDSVKEVDLSQQVVRSLDRKRLWRIQTPQVFSWELITRAHFRSNGGNQNAEASDDASLVEEFHPVHVVPGNPLNFKITIPEDLLFAEFLATRT